MLIVNNLHLSIGNHMNVYQSIVKNCNIALFSVENILNGMPQRAECGAFLLGLSAWHLYPDMIVHGSETKEIKQNDNLIPNGSMITLGL